MGSEVKNNRVLFLTSETELSKESTELSVPKRRFATMRLWRAMKNPTEAFSLSFVEIQRRLWYNLYKKITGVNYYEGYCSPACIFCR